MERVRERRMDANNQKKPIFIKMLLQKIWKKYQSEVKDRNQTKESKKFTLTEAGKLLRNQRECMNLSIQEISYKTKISIAVIEAIEEGWINKLPEEAYLISILNRLESELNMKAGSLRNVNEFIKSSKNVSAKKLGRGLKLVRIEILTGWTGNILYFIAILLSIFALNNNQSNNLHMNNNSVNPIPFDSSALSTNNTLFTEEQKLIVLNSLNDEQSIDIRQLISSILLNYTDSDRGKLEINLKNTRNLVLTSADGSKTNLKNVKGILSLNLRPPVSLKIYPIPSLKDKIIWQNKEASHLDGSPGSYRLEK